MILFGRIKNTDNEWGFNDDKNMFDTWKEQGGVPFEV